MEFGIKKCVPEKQRSHCLVIGVGANQGLQSIISEKKVKSFIKTITQQGDMSGNLNQFLLLQQVPHILAKRVLLIGLGKTQDIDDAKYKKIIQLSINTLLKHTVAADALFPLIHIPVKGRDLAWKIQQAILTMDEACYQFTRFKSDKPTAQKLKRILFVVSNEKERAAHTQALRQGQAIADAVKWTKDLCNLPGNVCTPAYLAKEAKRLALSHSKLNCKVLNEPQMKKLGMGALLSVSQGSKQEAKLIILQYKGGKASQKPICLVGKGITFDTGGISLKSSSSIMGMKYDMCGAASVLGVLQVACALKLPINVIGIMAAAENMPSSTATRPDDVVTSMSGRTIEVANTDAEGRLVLCDALTYCGRFKPEVVIDIATLTGACIVALGHSASALYSHHDALLHDLQHAGQAIGDRVWPMPLWEDYQPQLDSPIADICNTGGFAAGSITAACFLSRFTKDYCWAHLDVAGSAFHTGKHAHATGRPVPLLAQYLIDRVESAQS